MSEIIDVNSFMGHWPLRPVDGSVSDRLEEMDSLDIARGWISSLHGFFYDDPHEANKELFKKSRRYRDRLEPVPIVQPGVPLWRDELQKYISDWGVRMIRVVPGFRPWEPESKDFQEFFQILIEKNLVLLLQWNIEDPRSFQGMIRPTFLNLQDALLFLGTYSGKVILGGATFAQTQEVLAKTEKNVMAEVSYVDGIRCMERLLQKDLGDRLLFGTMSPLLVAKSVMLKVKCAEMPEEIRDKILSENARRFFDQK